jgi:mannose-6-phosphate isomerase-like protein (cupin superfamily)
MHVVRGGDLTFIPASHEKTDQPGVLKKVLGTKFDFVDGRVQMLNWSVCPKDSSFRRHYHEDMQEVFIILNGQVTMQIEHDTVELNAGDAVFIEPREVHKMTNRSAEDVFYIVFGISLDQDGQTIVIE